MAVVTIAYKNCKSSSKENVKSNIMWIAIIMTYGAVKGKQSLMYIYIYIYIYIYVYI